MIEDDDDLRELKEALYEEIRNQVLDDYMADRGNALSNEIEADIRPAIRERVFKEERENVLKNKEMVDFVIRQFFDNPSMHPSLENAKVTFRDDVIEHLMNDEEYMTELREELKGILSYREFRNEVRSFLMPELKEELLQELRSDEKYMEMLRGRAKEEVKQELIAYIKNEF